MDVFGIDDITNVDLAQVARFFARNELDDLAVGTSQAHFARLVIDGFDDGIDLHRLAGVERGPLHFFVGVGKRGAGRKYSK